MASMPSDLQLDLTSTYACIITCTDNDGSLVRLVNPTKPAGRYLIGSYVDWWNWDAGCWLEVRGVIWVPRRLRSHHSLVCPSLNLEDQPRTRTHHTRKNQQPKLSGIWVCPLQPSVQVARLDFQVLNAAGTSSFTSPYEVRRAALPCSMCRRSHALLICCC
jgi:hypothetical protein